MFFYAPFLTFPYSTELVDRKRSVIKVPESSLDLQDLVHDWNLNSRQQSFSR